MFAPDDPLKPPSPVFDEPWQAQTLAMADALVKSGAISASQWAEALGAALNRAQRLGDADSDATYFATALDALEGIATQATDVTGDMMTARKDEWIKAYLSTPHGEPVNLPRR